MIGLIYKAHECMDKSVPPVLVNTAALVTQLIQLDIKPTTLYQGCFVLPQLQKVEGLVVVKQKYLMVFPLIVSYGRVHNKRQGFI